MIARGVRAQGDAGRMGGGDEYLLAAHPGQFSIRRFGRLYGEPALLHVTIAISGDVTIGTTSEEDASKEW